MEEQPKIREINLFSYLQVLIHWRRFIVINVGILAVFAAVIVFLLPNTYKSTASIIPPQQESGLGGAISQITKGILPSSLLGKAGASQGAYNYLAILESRTAMETVVTRNNLTKVYDVGGNMNKAAGILMDNAEFEFEENGNITVSVTDKDPKLAAKMANDFVDILNEISIKLNTQEAHNNRMFIEERYLQVRTDLHDLEDSLQMFQSRYGIISLPDQTSAAIQSAAELRSQLIVAEIEKGVFERTLGSNSTEVALKDAEISELKSIIQRQLTGEKNTSIDASMLPSLESLPEIGIAYIRLYRDYQIQNTLLEFIIPLYEQAKVEENKTIPVVLILDAAIPPQKKYWPPRTIIILLVMIACFMMCAFVIFFMEYLGKSQRSGTAIESNIVSFVQAVKRFYRIR